MKRGLALIVAVICLGLAQPAFAAGADPAERLPDPAAEARARHLFKEIRCLMCQNESIDDSHALIAGDLRKVVRQQVAAGASDAQVKDFLVKRYGDFVLLRPRWTAGNMILWIGPFLVAIGGLGVLVMRGKSKPVPETPLTDEEIARLERLTTVSDNGRNL